MIYDVERLVVSYLKSLPATCEGTSIEELEDRIRSDLLDNRPMPFSTEGILHKGSWYKHHHRVPDGGVELQARRCYCITETREICEQRKSIPTSNQLPQITTDYDANLEAAFWNWVCNRRAGDDPRGDFIRDTRLLLEVGKNPGTRLWEASTEAVHEYINLRTRWADEIDVHPSDCSALYGRAKVSGTGWYYCCSECNNCDCDGRGCSCGCKTCSELDC